MGDESVANREIAGNGDVVERHWAHEFELPIWHTLHTEVGTVHVLTTEMRGFMKKYEDSRRDERM